jgi:YrbI family 3-deoxy-D-manno-octulosonate 8-phosphate phosphatase
MQNKKRFSSEKLMREGLFKDVKILYLDFDGVLTNNKVIVSEDGKESVICDRSDSLGISMLKNAGISVVVVSKERNPVVSVRCKKIGVECHQGVDDKLKIILEYPAHICSTVIDNRDWLLRHACYVGNDINDIECMKKVAVPVAVADAYPKVFEAARYVTTRNGGDGAVREVCDLILADLK